MKIPSSLTIGQTIEDANARIGIGFINCMTVMIEGKVIAEESVTTATRTFKYFKVSQKVNSSAMGIKTEGTTLTWYAKGIGSVKTGTINKRKGDTIAGVDFNGKSKMYVSWKTTQRTANPTGGTTIRSYSLPAKTCEPSSALSATWSRRRRNSAIYATS